MNASLKEGLKEGARLVALATVSYLLTAGVLDAIVFYFIGSYIDPVIVVQITALLTAILRSADKYMHEAGKASENVSLSKGLTRF